MKRALVVGLNVYPNGNFLRGFNQNILRKLALNVLKIVEIGKKKLSVRMKRLSQGNPVSDIFG